MTLILYWAVDCRTSGSLALDAGRVGRNCYFGWGRTLEGGESSVGWVTLRARCSWLENGPDERLPSPSIAYQSALMPRISDLSSLMKWGMAIVVLPCAGSSVKPASPRMGTPPAGAARA